MLWLGWSAPEGARIAATGSANHAGGTVRCHCVLARVQNSVQIVRWFDATCYLQVVVCAVPLCLAMLPCCCTNHTCAHIGTGVVVQSFVLNPLLIKRTHIS